MTRRHLPEEPTSQLAVWARRMAFFSLVATILAIIIVRSGLLELKPALATFGGALACAGVAFVLAFAAFVVIWNQGLRGMGHSFAAIAISLALLGYPVYLGVKAYQLPGISDITTDPSDPPRYDALAKARGPDANPIIYAGASIAEQQQAAYPDIEPLEVEASPRMAYDAALAVINKRKWRVLEARAPEAGRRDGRIEAVAVTLIMGFRDDVVVRVRAIPDGARVDVRSSSRYGSHDLGTNAARVRSLIEDIDNAIDTEAERLAKQPAKKAPVQPKRNQPAPTARR